MKIVDTEYTITSGCPKCDALKAKLESAHKAIRGLWSVTDEYAAEFINHKRAVNWGVVNEAFLLADKILKEK